LPTGYVPTRSGSLLHRKAELQVRCYMGIARVASRKGTRRSVPATPPSTMVMTLLLRPLRTTRIARPTFPHFSAPRQLSCQNNLLAQRLTHRTHQMESPKPSCALSPIPPNPLGEGRFIRTAAALVIGYALSCCEGIYWTSSRLTKPAIQRRDPQWQNPGQKRTFVRQILFRARHRLVRSVLVPALSSPLQRSC
jgi:hypothetical protein